MDNTYHHASPDTYNGGYPENPPYTANRAPLSSMAHEPPQPDLTAPPCPAVRGHDVHPYGYRSDHPPPPPGAAFGSSGFAPPFGFDPSVPPPHFWPPPAPFHGFPHQLRAPQAARGDQRQPAVRGFPQDQSPREDESSAQSRQDQLWISRFLQGREKSSRSPQLVQHGSIPDLRGALTRAAQLLSHLDQSCDTLRDNLSNDTVWEDTYLLAMDAKRELQDRLQVLSDQRSLDGWKDKVSRVAQRRSRRLRARRRLLLEESHREVRRAEKEAAVEKWWLHQLERAEQRKKEQDLKLAADSVLCEVRKKQADVKRMQDILTSLEKLRVLRKEAAVRKGIVVEGECDEAFGSRLEQLRSVMKKRTAVYSAEEKALMVMLEGEQEEERRREQEKRVKKEREVHMQRKRSVNAMLFGDDVPADSAPQPFREYYSHAERSLLALLQIRREWDVFVVPAEHPVGGALPHSWILPDAPSDQAWASAVQTVDTE